VNVTNTVNASATAYNSASPSTVSITTTVGSCLIYAAIGGWHNDNTFTAVTGFTITAQANGSDAIGAETGFASTATTYTAGFNVTTNAANESPVIAVAFTTGVLTPNVDTTNWVKM
jgi:hypothetical protein